ncbi:hypothetical protein K7432_014729 [Basidiobolus ranarum]|uniref:Uncharacterized protein n=1 Tax=Basidiobolus ranarum TaxID=34480 RepID=A0ABR2WH72_9FUNG
MDFSPFTRFYFPLTKGNGYEYMETISDQTQYLFRYKYKMHHNQTLTKYGYLVTGSSKEMIFHMSIVDKHQVANEKRLMKEIRKDPRVPNNLTVLDHSTASAVRYEIQQRHRNKIRLTHKPSIIDNHFTKIKRKISFEKLLSPPPPQSRKLKFDDIDIIFPYDPEAPSSIVSDPVKIGLTTTPPKSALKSPLCKQGKLAERLFKRASFLILAKS